MWPGGNKSGEEQALPGHFIKSTPPCALLRYCSDTANRRAQARRCQNGRRRNGLVELIEKGLVRPAIKRHKLTVFDVTELGAAWRKLKAGWRP